jgi:hypothetical protein
VQLIDDELCLELSRFAKGVRVLVLSDSCHSGTVTRAAVLTPGSGQRPRQMPPAVGKRVYLAHNALQDGLQRARLDVLAELFRIMHDLARESAVAQWSRADAGLKRRPRSRNAASDLIRAYLGAVKYVQNVKAQRRALSD